MPASLCSITCGQVKSQYIPSTNETAEGPTLLSLLRTCWLSWQPISFKENLLEGGKENLKPLSGLKEGGWLCL